MVVPAALIVSPAELSLRQVGGFLKIKEVVVVVSLLPRTAAHNEWCLGHNKWYQSISGSTWDHLLIQGHLLLIGRDHAYLGSELGLFVGSCVDLKTAYRLLEESILVE